MPVQKFRSIEEMARAPVLVRAEDGFGRFLRHCTRMLQLATILCHPRFKDGKEQLYVWVESAARVAKERAMRRRRLKRLWARLQALQRQQPTYETLLLKLGRPSRRPAGPRAWWR